MLLAALIVLAVLALTGLLLLAALAAPERGRPVLRGRQVVVHTRDDTSIRGVMVIDTPHTVVLETAEYLGGGGGKTVQVDGRAHFRAEQITWIQELTS